MAILAKVIHALSAGRSPVKGAQMNKRVSLASDGIHKNSVNTLGQIFYRFETIFLKGQYLSLFLFTAASILIGCQDHDHEHDHGELWQGEVDQLRSAVTSYDDIEYAKDKGYNSEVTGYVNHMGFHYLNTSVLDERFDVKNPELLLYVPDDHGGLKFVAVEYAVPIVDINNPPPAPEGFKGDSDVWEINTAFKLWTLHAWVGVDNPHGIFAPHNPNIP